MAEKEAGKFFKKLLSRASREELPLIPLRDVVVFPKVAMPLVIKREPSLKALHFAEGHGRVAVFVAQKSAKTDEVEPRSLYDIGVVCKIREVVKEQEGAVRILVEGITRVRILKYTDTKDFMKVYAQPLVAPGFEKSEKVEALRYSIIDQFKEVINLGATVPLDVLMMVVNMSDTWQMLDLIAVNVDFKISEKQAILEASSIEMKLQMVSKALIRQGKVLRMAKKLQNRTGKELNKMQKELYLREQLKAIEKELGEESGKTDVQKLAEEIKKLKIDEEDKKKIMDELKRMERMPTFSPEISYIRTYLDWIVAMPWEKKTKSNINVVKCRKILDEDHYGLDKVKERVQEFLAVQKMVGKIKGPILCFYGPPGTGKTSIGKSIARSMGRKFVRMSLGGIRDEAEIRGHRRTYVGALPGRIIQGIRDAGSSNPVFMLDEIDKVGKDFRGDPSSALLEALDPEQNNEFSDHYLEIPYDLSDVMFITTANVLDTIPPALQDRMEVIDFPGYTDMEKFHIAKGFLIPRQIKNNGLSKKIIKISDPALKYLIRGYTREAGVRNLDREIASVCRKVARDIASKKIKSKSVGLKDIEEYLGPRKFLDVKAERAELVGVATGLAWTQVGGEILKIEALKMPGKGQLQMTGQLGKVMKESAEAAYSFARSKMKKYHIEEKFYKDCDVHVHVPMGAIPKDGPSAGVSITSAIVSALSGVPVDNRIGMTGEITLRGEVLEIGGVKEKVLAAHRSGLEKVILPERNEKDLKDVPDAVKKKLEFVYVKTLDEVLKHVLVYDKTEKSKKKK